MSSEKSGEWRSLQTEAGALRGQFQSLVAESAMTKEMENVSEALRNIASGANRGNAEKIQNILGASASALAEILAERPDIETLYYDEVKKGQEVVLAQDFILRYDERNILRIQKGTMLHFENNPSGEMRFRILPANTLVVLSPSMFPVNIGILVYKKF